ncbi:dipeptide/oligopeptide/nickel ABC transporter ATP-binding protein [Shinella sp.]|uniref:dipeptide/oligopeptide/nickel ABC transporter ATP-binding protein n=1 Tax=Shinella sp. TaxID=1870904 RepID=UPI0028AB9676|nr:dipeptide/oligopeptide/nickel ABC transporter ATP-binding protein [Shinella sp.]
MAVEAPLIEVRSLRKTFEIGRGLFPRVRRSVAAVDDVAFSIRDGEAVGLIGGSGSGKSTIAGILTGLERADAGSVSFNGVDLSRLAEKDRLAYRRHIQLVPQDASASLNPRRRIGVQIAEPMLNLGIVTSWQEAQRETSHLLERVGLRGEDVRRFPHAFSGGQRQRINIARTLGVKARFVILDEPTSALDVSIQAQILDLLRELKREFGLTYLFIGHNLGVIQSFCERILVMEEGRLVDSFASAELGHAGRHEATRRLVEGVLPIYR